VLASLRTTPRTLALVVLDAAPKRARRKGAAG
jgi:hypothetical protein